MDPVTVLAYCGLAAVLCGFAYLGTGRRADWMLFLSAGNLLESASAVLHRDWAWTAYFTLMACLLGRDWWNRRGRKAAKALGAKSRALVARLVERAREAGAPAPGGVPA